MMPAVIVMLSLIMKDQSEVKKENMIRTAVMELDKIDQIINKHNGEASSLIQVLLEIQTENHWLPKEALKRVSEKLQVPLTRIQHIATFYKAFSLVPKGRHEIHICMGTACHVRGAPRLLDTVQQLTGIKPGETDPDLKFSLETVNCLGCCALGPVMEIDGKHHGKMAPAKTREVLKNYQ
jgi:NADH-quinone oxidoreductase subunit E